MNADTQFLNQISKIKKQVFLIALRRSIAISLVLFLGGMAAATGISITGFYDPYAKESVYGILVGSSLVFSAAYVFLRRKKFIDILIDIDRRLKLRDRISTAYEYRTNSENSELAVRLLEDTGRRLSMFSGKEIFPKKFSILHLLLGMLILINISLFFIGRFNTVSDKTAVDREKREKIISMLEAYPPRKEKKQKKQTNKKQLENQYKKMKNLTEKLGAGPMTKDRLLSSLNKLLKSVQEENSHLAKTLVSKVGIQKIDHVAVQKTVRLEKLSSDEQKQLRLMLKKIIGGRMSGDLSNDLSTLDEQNNLAELLGRIITDVESDDGGVRPESDGKKGGRPEGNDSRRRSGRAGMTKQKEMSSKLSQGGKQAGSQTGFDQDKEDGMDGEEDPDSRDGTSSSAGDAKSKGREKSPHEIEKVKGVAFPDKTISTQTKTYSAPVRSLAGFGKAKVKEEDMVRPYQQEIESILNKADIPLNYRTYIKNYFISIGLNTGEKTK